MDTLYLVEMFHQLQRSLGLLPSSGYLEVETSALR
jgi:hypothetical protein